ANMSHELRTPLNAIIGFTELMHQQTFGPIGDPRYQQYSSDILESGDHLLSLINDILDLSKIEAGQVELNEAKVDIAELGHDCLRSIEIQVEEAGLFVDLGGTAGLPQLWADERMLRQMLLNLLSNAVKFTKRDGRITVSGKHRANGTMAISVADNGVGIAAADVPKALANFGQVENVLDRYHEGTGLGLPLVASMAELHGGGMQIESEPGVGTTVTIWIPKERVLAAV
ncbi:MAG: HAMP domain-containing sensor histidine kinase, partial [Alphaproteobacteria bacterium]|nr:HAMP domain-containing sensor histidine kinase [Alphaproteobacteria bacterium]